MSGSLTEAVGSRLAEVRTRISGAGADPDAVTIVAVTKGFGADAVLAALDNGLVDIGENYADELVAKAGEVTRLEPDRASAIRWPFQGDLQSNKINRLAPHVSLWQTIGSANRAASLAQRVPGADVLVQVKVVGAQNRSGCDPVEVAGVVEACRALGLRPLGLMAVGPDPSAALDARSALLASDAAFAMVRELADALELPIRSMGMTDDFERAIAASATMIRLGSFLFGRRDKKLA